MRRLLVTVSVVIGALVALGCGVGPASPVTVVNARSLPVSGEADGLEFVIAEIRSGTPRPGSNYARMGDWSVWLPVRVRNVTDHERSLILTQFTIVTQSGRQIEEVLIAAPEALSRIPNLLPGSHVTGLVFFVLEEDDPPRRLVIDPNPLTDTDLHVEFDDGFSWNRRR